MPVDFIEEVEPTSIDFVEEAPAPMLRGSTEPSIRSTIAGGTTVQTMPFTESIQEPVETATRMVASTEPAIPFTKLIPSPETPTTLAERGLAMAIPGGAVASALYGPEVPVAGLRSLARGVLSVPEFLTSPLGISTAGVASLGKVAQTLVSLGFSVDMAKSLYQQGASTIKNWGTMTPEQRVDALVSMAQTAGFAGAAGVHGVKGAVGLLPKRPVEPAAVPPVIPPPIPKTPPPLPRLAETPDVETALRQPESAESLTEIDKEIARAKQISPAARGPQPTEAPAEPSLQPAPEVAAGEKIVAPETTIPEHPKEMFHGTRTAGTLKIGQGKNLNTQGLWLSDYESKASEFSEGRPSDEGIASVRSVEFTPSKTKKVYGPDLKHTDANDLIKQGYDSVYVPDTGFWIALKESAFKEKQPTQPKAEYAVPIESPNALYVEPTPRSSETMGEGIPPEGKEPTRTQAETGAKTEAPVAQPPSKPAEGGGGVPAKMLSSGEVTTTSSGRKTTPFPKVTVKSNLAVKRVDEWLRQNAIDEAKSRGDEFNQLQFQNSNPKKLTQAEKDSMNEYLFGQQPEVQKPILKEVKPTTPPTAGGEGKPIDKAKEKIDEVASTEGKRAAKEIKSELVQRLEDAIQKAPSVLDERPKGVPDKITIEIPDDGTFTVFNSKEVIQRLLNRASRIETTPYKSEPQKPKRHLNPMAEAKDRILAEKRDAAENLRAIKDVHGETTRGYRAAQEMGIKAPKEWLKTPDEPTQPPPEVGEKPIGLGGAVPEEFSRTGSPTANKNAVIDAEAIRRGEKPLMAAIKQTWGDVASQAEGMVDRDPGLPQRLVDELLAKPRVLTPQEHVVLLRHRVDLRYEYHKAAREAAQAVADGRTQDAAADTIRTNEWSEKLSDLDKAVGRGGAGTEAGRSLQIRRMMMNEDYTLANLELQKRADNGFRMLTPDERAQLQKIAADYKAKADALEKHLAEKSTRIAALEAEAEMQRIKAESVPKGPSYDKRILDYAERIVTSMESQADAALARIKARGRMGKVGSGPLHELPNIADYAIVGSARLARFGVDIAKWTDSMIRDLGEEIRPHLPRILELSNGLLDEKLKKVPAAVVNAVRKVTPQEAKAQIVGKISAKIKGGKKQEISFMVQKLARQLYEEGIQEREPMVDALHQLLPEMSREEVRDAFSGYGDYKQLSKDQITVALRGMKGELQQIAKLEAMAAGEPPLKSGLERRTPTEAERKLIKEVNDAKYKFQVPSDDPNTQLQSALDTLKKTLRNRITDYTDKLAKGEFEKKPRRQVVMDDEAIRLKAQVERIKKDWEIAREKDRLARRQGWQKFADGFVRWERNFKLSSPVVFGKLSAAALTRLVTTTAEEAVGAGISKVLPKLAEKAPREGGFNAKAMSIAIRRAFSKGLNDAAQTAKTGAADVDVTYGDKIVDKDWANVFGRLHGMMKAPIKRAEIELSFQKRVEHAIRNGIDPTDPMVEARLMAEALNDGYRSIFMQRGFSSDTFNQLVSMMERNKNYPVAGELSARFARFMLPVVRVPINIVSETATGVHGTATASARLLWHATHEGLANLDPVVADSIMRQFKKGSIGLGLMAIGFLNSEHIGGYDWRDKRKPEDPKAGGFRIFGLNVPRWVTHAPWFELLQFGATIRRTMDKHIAKEGAPQAISNGMWAAGLGLIEETPFVGNMLRVDKLFQSPAERTRYMAELAKGTLIPQAVQWSAGQMDKPVPFSPLEEPTKRKPKTFMEHIKMGLPMMRQQVPENQARQSKAALIP